MTTQTITFPITPVTNIPTNNIVNCKKKEKEKEKAFQYMIRNFNFTFE